jgi:hypothetical protein
MEYVVSVPSVQRQKPLLLASGQNGDLRHPPKPRWVRFSDRGSAQLVQVRCTAPETNE